MSVPLKCGSVTEYFAKLIVVVFVNCLGSKAYGEFEFVFSLFKILLIMTLIILGILMDAGVWKKP